MPSATMIALLAVNSGQLYGDWHTATSRENAVQVRNSQFPTLELFYALQQERALSAAALADPAGYAAKLAQVRKASDASITMLKALPDANVAASITASVGQFTALLGALPQERTAIDDGTATQQQVYDEYSNLISANIGLFTSLTQTGVPSLDVIGVPALTQAWGQEMISREAAVITAGSVSGHLTAAERSELDQSVGAEQFIYQDQVIPDSPAPVSGLYQSLLASRVWQQKTQVEQGLLAEPPSATTGESAVPPALGGEWQQMMASLSPQLVHMTEVQTTSILSNAGNVIGSLKTRLIVQTAFGAAAVLLVVGLTWWLITMLRRRIFALRSAAGQLETRLPIVVERLRRGEAVDTDAELPELSYGGDELGMLGRSLNAARASALETSVRQVDQYRGFERLLQRIARRTQLLINLQMKRLSEMERRYEDSEVLEGLFDLDHLAARLRRYEENLVILGGGQPQRRWRKPVPLLNILRSAQGEVQDYRRIRIETESRVWISERAVSPLVHVLAELMENAVAFSKPPTPVEVTAAPVARGLAVEIEDRGVGMEPEQYAEANALLVDLPRLDVLSRADDARLGLYVVARLAANLGVKVELRPSSFGGTRAVVLIPTELVLAAGQVLPSAEGEDDLEFPSRLSALAPVPSGALDASAGNGGPHDPAESADRPDDSERLLVGVGGRSPDPDPAPPLDPLPRRVRQASLVAELRDLHETGGDEPADPDEPPADSPAHEPSRSGAAVAAFQRQSRLARLAENGAPAEEEDGGL
ncbi:MAG TPA: sensor histidine kinase [Actinocrinis sp.]